MARHIRVVSPDDLPEFGSTAAGSLDFEHQFEAEDAHHRGRICLSSESFLSGLVLLVAALLLVMVILTVYCIRDRKERSPAISN